MCGSPYYKFSQWVLDILTPVRAILSPYMLNDTFKLLPYLEEINVKNQIIASIDISSLFTNIPLNETIEFLCSIIDDEHIDVKLPTAILGPLLLTCTKNVIFQFQGHMYQQVDGVAMGSPLGPFLAEVFMTYIERKLENTIASMTLYKRYVDDILVIAESHEHIRNIVHEFNHVHPNTTATVELENNDEIPFLDIQIHRRTD